MIRERLAPDLASGTTRLLLLLRDLPLSATREIDDTPEWLLEMELDGAIIELESSITRTRAVVEHLRSDLIGLSEARLNRLHAFCGGDLLLLDELLNTIGSPLDLDSILPTRMLYSQIRNRYFGGNRVLPTITRMAYLAQFEVLPAATFLDVSWREDEKERAAPFTTELFAPRRYKFLHSSLAELVLRAQLSLESSADGLEHDVEAGSISALRAYLLHLLQTTSGVEFTTALQLLMRSRLKLTDTAAESRIKAAVLMDVAVRNAVETQLEDLSFRFLHFCVMHLSSTDAAGSERYVQLVENRARMLLSGRGLESDRWGLAGLRFGFLTLARHNPDRLAKLLNDVGVERCVRLITSHGTITDLFRIISYAPPTLGEGLLALLDEPRIDALVATTNAHRSSVGTLHLLLRGVRRTSPALADELELKVGAQRFLSIIASNGTLFAFLRLLGVASPLLRDDLLQQLDDQKSLALIEKTIASGCSIGALTFVTRELGMSDPAMLARLENQIGPEQFLRLIVANGTIFELFSVLKFATSQFREALLDHLNDAEMDALVAKTIRTGRSIGALGFTTRELRRSDPPLLARLEQRVGPQRLLTLIVSNGTVFDLFIALHHATSQFRTALLNELAESTAQKLVDKTIARGRSVGTLAFAMRELKRNDPAVLQRLEQKVGAESFVRLLASNGDLLDLLGIFKHVTFAFLESILDNLRGNWMSMLVAKAIQSGRRIESLHNVLRRMDGHPAQKARLEEAVGIRGWWLIIINLGTLNSLSQISQAMSGGFRAHFVSAAEVLTIDDWRRLAERGWFSNLCSFATDDLGEYGSVSRASFREMINESAIDVVAGAEWYDLNMTRLPTEPSIGQEGEVLRAVLRDRLARVEIRGVSGLEFRAAINALACLWRERADLRTELVRHWHEIVPASDTWPRKAGEVMDIRFLLNVARSPMVPAAVAKDLLEQTGSFLDREVCTEIPTIPLIEIVWEMAATRYEREADHSFSQALPRTLVNTLQAVVEDRIKRSAQNEERAAQLALGGLLAFLAPETRGSVTKVMKPLRGTAARVERIATDLSFLPALFALEGIALLQGGEVLFTPFVAMGLLAKSRDETPGPAIEQLRGRVNRNRERH